MIFGDDPRSPWQWWQKVASGHTAAPSAGRGLICVLAFWLIPASWAPPQSSRAPQPRARGILAEHPCSVLQHHCLVLLCSPLIASQALALPDRVPLFLALQFHFPRRQSQLSPFNRSGSVDGFPENDAPVWSGLGLLCSGVAQSQVAGGLAPPSM